MNIVNASYKVYPVCKRSEMLKKIESIARVCYRSEDRICEGSDVKMVGNLVKRRHEAMLEHASLIFKIDDRYDYEFMSEYVQYLRDYGYPCMIRMTWFDRGVVSGNIRMWRDFIRNSLDFYKSHPEFTIPNIIAQILAYKYNWRILFDDLDCDLDVTFGNELYIPIEVDELTEQEMLVHYDLTVKFTVDRGVGSEIVRHRLSSFAHESSRYCNYSKGSFGSEITVVKPCFFEEGTEAYAAWEEGCKASEKAYMRLLELGRTPQEARDVLPLSLKAELCMTANLNEWIHFLNLRAMDSTGPAHPQIKEVAVPLLADLRIFLPGIFGDLNKEN